jgi:hypothetical protein
MCSPDVYGNTCLVAMNTADTLWRANARLAAAARAPPLSVFPKVLHVTDCILQERAQIVPLKKGAPDISP